MPSGGIIGGASTTIGALTGSAAGVLGGPLGIAGASLLGTVANGVMSGINNRAARNFAEDQANQQRQWALEDWDRNNAYNSPSAQMQRLKDAGLNPNLVYGNGATTTAQPVRSSAPAQWSPHAPQVDASQIGSNIMMYYDIKNKAAQYDNIKAQTDVIKQEALLKAALVDKTWQDLHLSGYKTDLTAEQLWQLQEQRPFNLDAKRSLVDKMLGEINYMAGKNQREGQLAGSTLALNAEKIENLRREGKLKDIELRLGEMGINKNDPAYMRILIQLSHKLGILE